MNKFLLVGDMHVKRDNLEESRKLILWIVTLCQYHNAIPIFMGDQYDSMGIIRAEVLEFWVWAYGYINNALSGVDDKICSISLAGNHDLNADSTACAMSAHEKHTTVAASHLEPYSYLPIGNEIAAIGFVRDNETFIKLANHAYQNGRKYILCHAEFNGAQYENGFYAPHGIDISKLPPATFLSGHIHKQQRIVGQFDKALFYIGTPRMLTRSDIGERKGVWIWDGKDELTFAPTPADVSEPFQYISVKEGSPIPEIPNSSRVYVDVEGSTDFVKKACTKMPELAKVRSLPKDDNTAVEIKESEGVSTAFLKYAFKYGTEKGLSVEYLKSLVVDIHNRCPILKVGE